MTDPIDPLHEQCIEAREQIRHHVENLKALVAEWEPMPWPLHAATRRAEWAAHLATGTADGAPRYIPRAAARAATKKSPTEGEP